MAAEPAETLIGVAGVGFGILMLYAMYTNKALFGSGGILTEVLTTGKWPDMKNVPNLFGDTMLGKKLPDNSGGGGGGAPRYTSTPSQNGGTVLV